VITVVERWPDTRRRISTCSSARRRWPGSPRQPGARIACCGGTALTSRPWLRCGTRCRWARARGRPSRTICSRSGCSTTGRGRTGATTSRSRW